MTPKPFLRRSPTRPKAASLRSGQTVRIRTAEEILATLDDSASREGMPFMPEMLEFCGRTVRVAAVAHKTCDTIHWTGLRRMRRTVHLDGLRCDGSAHGGCQAGCLLFWKEDWLDRAGANTERSTGRVPGSGVRADAAARLRRACRLTSEGESSETRWSCQATQLFDASEPQPWWDVRQYFADLTSGNVAFWALLRGMFVFVFNKYQGFSKRFLPPRLRVRRGAWYPFIAGPRDTTPTSEHALKQGDQVRVKSRDEILSTLDGGGRNRGLSFDAEMLPYCSTETSVLRRVERIIDEATGEMRSIGRDCLILDGVTCTARYHRFCPRAIYPYWREVWLEPVGDSLVDLHSGRRQS